MKRKSFYQTTAVVTLAGLTLGFANISPRVIYGDDNRVDIYQVERVDVREIADSTVALVQSKNLSKQADGQIKLKTVSFGLDNGLCADEPFYTQPTAAFCSGFLVGDDLVATAGHCIRATDCKKTNFVFGFKMNDATSAQDLVSESEVYGCKEVVARELTNDQDYSLVRLDRPVRGHRILKLQDHPVNPGDSVYVVGHPSGLPTKVADGATVRAQTGAFFRTNTDTYGGNSGSAVFNAQTNEVVGILVRGETDFIYDSVRKCTRSKVCESNSCGGEDVTNIEYINQAIKR